MRQVDNLKVAQILREIGQYLQMDEEDVFRYRAYERAADSIEGWEQPVAEVYTAGGQKALEEIPGVGASISEKIIELLTTGKVHLYEQLQKKTPVHLSELRAVEGLGPKHIHTLYTKLKIRTLAGLEKAARQGKIQALEGFGPKVEDNILQSIAFLKQGHGRFLLGHIIPFIRDIEERLRRAHGVEEVVVCGSVRRRKETIGDVDLLVIAEDSSPVMELFTHIPEVAQVLAHGPTKSMVRLRNGLEMDLRVVPRASFGAALHYFTGSKEHNIALRQRAIDRGYKLNEYGLFKGRKQIAGATEEDVYRALDLPYIEPELREMKGELAAAEAGTLPHLVGYKDLRGDLQVQTNWTDGAYSIYDMARAAADAGLEYIVITDHTKRLVMIHGLDEQRVREQRIEIDRVNERLQREGVHLRVLAGTECDILKHGELDLPDDVLAELDVVGASIHSHFSLPRAEQTQRLMRAMDNSHVDIIFHPTGRALQKRPGCDMDMPAIVAHAKKTGTVMEANAFPDRLDLRDEHIRLCVAAGVKLAIDSDAHSISHFSVVEYGIAQARRGWATKADIINAWPLPQMLSMLKDGHRKKVH